MRHPTAEDTLPRTIKEVVSPGPQPRMRIEFVALEQLATWPGNPKNHDLVGLGESFERFGYVDPIVFDEKTQRIVAGHGRLEQLSAMKGLGEAAPGRIEVAPDGTWLVPVLRGVEFKDEREAEAYLIASNRLVEKGGWDSADLIKMVASHQDDLVGIGWSADEVAKLVADAEREALPEIAEDDAPEPPKKAVTQPGDIWRLGRHRLICGDSTHPDVVRNLLGATVPFIMVTDPPYGVEYEPEWKAEAGLHAARSARMGKVMNDDRSSWLDAWKLFAGDVAYTWCSDLNSVIVANDLDAADLIRRALIVWKKPVFVVGRAHYHWQHELCWYAVRKNATAKWAGDRKQSTVWDISRKDGHEETIHSTQKPVECMARPIRHHGSREDAVYDPFCGSGTTISAAEQLERQCFAVELDPAYCDVIVERWQNLTGQKAERSGTARPRRRRVSRDSRAPAST